MAIAGRRVAHPLPNVGIDHDPNTLQPTGLINMWLPHDGPPWQLSHHAALTLAGRLISAVGTSITWPEEDAP